MYVERILKNFHVIHVQPTAGQIMYYLKCIVIQWLTFEEKTNKQTNKKIKQSTSFTSPFGMKH